LALGERVGSEVGLPVFLYGAVGGGRRPAFFRVGGPEALQARIDSGELEPEFGPSRLDTRAGAVLVGARPPLVAFNVELGTVDVEVARAVAAVVREAGGGFPGVRALGLELPRSGRVQVSMNVEDWRAAPLHEVVARVEAEAQARGVEVAGGELVGLLPAGAALAAAAPALRLEELGPARVLELRLLEAE
jgi:glutamate formiminotransferase